MRQRGRGTWELRVHLGLDSDTGRRPYATRTCMGPDGRRRPRWPKVVEDAAYSRLRAGTVGQLLGAGGAVVIRYTLVV